MSLNWSTFTRPSGVEGFGASDGTYLYFHNSDDPAFERYDPDTNSWTSLTNFGAARYYAGCCYLNGKIYVFGGFEGADTFTTRIYTIATDTWSTGATRPSGGGDYWYYPSAVSDGTNIYLMCGVGNGSNPGVNNGCWKYDVAGNSWSQKTDHPTGSDVPGGVLANGLIYIMGGDTGVLDAEKNNHAYNPFTDTWATLNFLDDRGVGDHDLWRPQNVGLAWDGANNIYAVTAHNNVNSASVDHAIVGVYSISGDSWSFETDRLTATGNPLDDQWFAAVIDETYYFYQSDACQKFSISTPDSELSLILAKVKTTELPYQVTHAMLHLGRDPEHAPTGV